MNGPGEEARAARDAGIGLAADHANAVEPRWTDRAYENLVAFCHASPGKSFTSEDVRDYAHNGRGLPEPAHRRAWGAVFQRAARVGLIHKAGINESRAAHCHCSHVGQWRVAVSGWREV